MKRNTPEGQKDFERKKKRIRMQNSRLNKGIRDGYGNTIREALFQSTDTSHEARVAPDRRYFGPTRTVTQDELTDFRNAYAAQSKKPYTVLVKSGKIPLSLLKEDEKKSRRNVLDVQTYSETFGPKKQRKRVKMGGITSFEELAAKVSDKKTSYDETKDTNIKVVEDSRPAVRHSIFNKGQSSRIWSELYKVIDSSDVIIQVLDARDPLGTRCYKIEDHVKKNCPHKNIILVLNKCDLVPGWVAKKWVYNLSRELPTVAFHASLGKPFGKGALIHLLRQFQNIHKSKPQISVGFVGYPNVGKSSIINALNSKKVCSVAPIPGQTKIWQYITLFKRIYLIDCPGVVYPSKDEEDVDIILKGIVRIEKIEQPSQYIDTLISRTKRDYIQKTYDIKEWQDGEHFLEIMARKTGKLKKGGDPDIEICARTVIRDWMRGKIPFFIPPPDAWMEPKDTPESKLVAVEQKMSDIKTKDYFDEEDTRLDKDLYEAEKDEEFEQLDNLDWEQIMEDIEKNAQ